MKKLQFQARLDCVSDGIPFQFFSNIVELEVEQAAIHRSIKIPFACECPQRQNGCDARIVAMLLALTCF